MRLNGFSGAPAVIGVFSETVVKVALLAAPPPDDEHAASVAAPASTATGSAR